MSLYRQHKLSLIRHAKALASTITPVPAFVDLDAHAELDTTPETDWIGIAGFSLNITNKGVNVFVSYVCSTWNDTDLMRMTEMVDKVSDALIPGKQVPLWLQNPGAGVKPTWLVVADDMMVEPTDKAKLRAVQFITVRMVSSQTT
jgi:hypothetical protein